MIKKVTIRLVLVITLLIVMNIVYSKLFYLSDLESYSSSISKTVLDINPNSDIIYIGESSNNTFHINDNDKRNIGEFLSDYYPKLITSSVAQSAGHAGHFYDILSTVPDSEKKRTVVVTLNIGSFGKGWIFVDNEVALEKESILIKDRPALLNKALLSFKDYSLKSQKEFFEELSEHRKNSLFKNLPFELPFKNLTAWDSSNMSNYLRDDNGNRSRELTSVASKYIKNYAFQINFEESERIKQFDKIIALSKEKNWNLVLNLLADNVQKAELLVGPELVYFIEENAKILEGYFKNKNIKVVNNLKAVSDSEFRDQNEATVHYAEKGRKIIAHNVANAIKEFYPKQYENVGFKEFLKSYKNLELAPYFELFYLENKLRLFNDFEFNQDLARNKLYTDSISFSGKYCVFTHKNKKYSPVYSLKPDKVNFNELRGVIVKGKFLCQSKVHVETAIIIETITNSPNEKRIWKGIPISSFSVSPNNWSEFEIPFSFPQEIKNALELKVYLFNPTEQKVFLDDFELLIK